MDFIDPKLGNFTPQPLYNENPTAEGLMELLALLSGGDGR